MSNQRKELVQKRGANPLQKIQELHKTTSTNPRISVFYHIFCRLAIRLISAPKYAILEKITKESR